MSTNVTRVEITDEESVQIRTLLDEIASDYRMLDQFYFVEHAHIIAHDLPRRVREIFYRFLRDEKSSSLLVTGNPVLTNGPGATPETFVEEEPGYELNDAQILHGLYGSLLGEPVSFTSQRGGSIYTSIIPLPNMAGVPNSSSGSNFDFGFHIEDAFHPARAEFVGLACMRNDEQAVTTVSCVGGINLSGPERDALFEPQFLIGHNPIHSTRGVVAEERQSVFFGPRDRPYVRVNFAALDIDRYDGVARRALLKLKRHFEINRTQVVLSAGDCLYIDNFRCAHARDAFDPLPAGACRWLSRIVLTSDLRKSAAHRSDTATRQIAA